MIKRSPVPPPILDSETLQPVKPVSQKSDKASDLPPRAQAFLRQLRGFFRVLQFIQSRKG